MQTGENWKSTMVWLPPVIPSSVGMAKDRNGPKIIFIIGFNVVMLVHL